MSFVPALIGAGASLLGGLLNSSNQDQINQQNIAMQEEFAQNGIQWKVEDAKKAGINPLAALGASTSSFSNLVGSDGVGNGVANAGQSVERAMQSTATQDDRNFLDQQHVLQLQHGELENQLLASQIRSINQPANGPPTPAPGQRYLVDGQGAAAVPGSSGAVRVEPDKVVASPSYDPTIASGMHTDVQFTPLGGGQYFPSPSKDAQGASFGSDFAPMLWDVRNLALPSVGVNMHPPFAAPRGKVWTFNPWRGYYLIDQGPDVSGAPFYPTSFEGG